MHETAILTALHMHTDSTAIFQMNQG